MELSFALKRQLVNSARNAIFKQFDLSLAEHHPDRELYAGIYEPSGAFVTLTIDDNLRGCIGYIVSEKPLVDTVKDAAVQAAFSDPRFPALSRDEMNIIDLEISVLSKPFPLDSYDDIEIGKHGLILTEGLNRALLLPQVPVEHNLDRDAFLSALCSKAGLYEGYWREKKLKLEAFTAEVFSENDLEYE